MAAEKITKGRLIQIVVTLSVLIAVFSWRTIQHSSTNATHYQQCWTQQPCEIRLGETLYRLRLSESNTEFSVITDQIGGNKALIHYYGASYQISTLIPIDSDKPLQFTMDNEENSVRVVVNKK
ncbi:hypothetical protein [Vibrio rarus]|uniref:hypothetical protein n=1 Tax=Vibrio rarus TaxID=413403 RepID=UPI0021C37137|nr:hypothetical protein [Vibrio rarus]